MDALSGIRVLDFSWGVAGPYATMLLALFGAEVIKVENEAHPDLMRVNLDPVTRQPLDPELSVLHQTVNLNKRSIRLDLRKPQGVELAKALVRASDAVVESYRPGVMAQLGLGYPVLRDLKPDIVMLSISAAGGSGPDAYTVGLAPLFAALGGLGELTGYPDGPPSEIRFTVDFMCALSNSFALLTALNHRRRTGRGQHVDTSLREEISCLVGDSFLDYAMNTRVQSRGGNRDDIWAPHNCYPCLGEDKWVSIAVTSDEEWQALSRAAGHSEWASDDRFCDACRRWRNQEELDALLGDWTLQHTAYEVTEMLQGAGVAAFPSLNAEELFSDTHINAREVFQVVEHPRRGPLFLLAPPWKLSGTPAMIGRYAPLMGEDNRYVFGELLGLSTAEIARLEGEGVLY